MRKPRLLVHLRYAGAGDQPDALSLRLCTLQKHLQAAKKNRRIAAIANAIERVIARQRKILKTRRNFDHDEAVAKLL